MRKKFYCLTALALSAVLLLGGCGSRTAENTETTKAAAETTAEAAETTESESKADGETEAEESSKAAQKDENAPELPGLTYESTMELTYAECFDVYNYEGGYSLIDVHDSARYLVVPDGRKHRRGWIRTSLCSRSR